MYIILTIFCIAHIVIVAMHIIKSKYEFKLLSLNLFSKLLLELIWLSAVFAGFVNIIFSINYLLGVK